MPVPIVVDLSHWNESPDFAKMKAAGVVGVILKATEGTTNVDETFAARRKAASAAGLKVSSYHFLRPGDINGQMVHYLKTIVPQVGERVCLDHEDAKVSLAALESAVQYLQADSRNLQVTVYSGHLIKEQLGSKRSAILATTSLWLAQYTSGTPSWPTATWPAWSLWQYTDKATVPGCPKPVDGNEWNGTTENLIKWFGPAGSAPAPAPEPKPEQQVLVALTVPEGVEVVVTVNGQPR